MNAHTLLLLRVLLVRPLLLLLVVVMVLLVRLLLLLLLPLLTVHPMNASSSPGSAARQAATQCSSSSSNLNTCRPMQQVKPLTVLPSMQQQQLLLTKQAHMLHPCVPLCPCQTQLQCSSNRDTWQGVQGTCRATSLLLWLSNQIPSVVMQAQQQVRLQQQWHLEQQGRLVLFKAATSCCRPIVRLLRSNMSLAVGRQQPLQV